MTKNNDNDELKLDQEEKVVKQTASMIDQKDFESSEKKVEKEIAKKITERRNIAASLTAIEQRVKNQQDLEHFVVDEQLLNEIRVKLSNMKNTIVPDPEMPEGYEYFALYSNLDWEGELADLQKSELLYCANNLDKALENKKLLQQKDAENQSRRLAIIQVLRGEMKELKKDCLNVEQAVRDRITCSENLNHKEPVIWFGDREKITPYVRDYVLNQCLSTNSDSDVCISCSWKKISEVDDVSRALDNLVKANAKEEIGVIAKLTNNDEEMYKQKLVDQNIDLILAEIGSAINEEKLKIQKQTAEEKLKVQRQIAEEERQRQIKIREVQQREKIEEEQKKEMIVFGTLDQMVKVPRSKFAFAAATHLKTLNKQLFLYKEPEYSKYEQYFVLRTDIDLTSAKYLRDLKQFEFLLYEKAWMEVQASKWIPYWYGASVTMVGKVLHESARLLRKSLAEKGVSCSNYLVRAMYFAVELYSAINALPKKYAPICGVILQLVQGEIQSFVETYRATDNNVIKYNNMMRKIDQKCTEYLINLEKNKNRIEKTVGKDASLKNYQSKVDAIKAVQSKIYRNISQGEYKNIFSPGEGEDEYVDGIGRRFLKNDQLMAPKNIEKSMQEQVAAMKEVLQKETNPELKITKKETLLKILKGDIGCIYDKLSEENKGDILEYIQIVLGDKEIYSEIFNNNINQLNYVFDGGIAEGMLIKFALDNLWKNKDWKQLFGVLTTKQIRIAENVFITLADLTVDKLAADFKVEVANKLNNLWNNENWIELSNIRKNKAISIVEGFSIPLEQSMIEDFLQERAKEEVMNIINGTDATNLSENYSAVITLIMKGYPLGDECIELEKKGIFVQALEDKTKESIKQLIQNETDVGKKYFLCQRALANKPFQEIWKMPLLHRNKFTEEEQKFLNNTIDACVPKIIESRLNKLFNSNEISDLKELYKIIITSKVKINVDGNTEVFDLPENKNKHFTSENFEKLIKNIAADNELKGDDKLKKVMQLYMAYDRLALSNVVIGAKFFSSTLEQLFITHFQDSYKLYLQNKADNFSLFADRNDEVITSARMTAALTFLKNQIDSLHPLNSDSKVDVEQLKLNLASFLIEHKVDFIGTEIQQWAKFSVNFDDNEYKNFFEFITKLENEIEAVQKEANAIEEQVSTIKKKLPNERFKDIKSCKEKKGKIAELQLKLDSLPKGQIKEIGNSLKKILGKVVEALELLEPRSSIDKTLTTLYTNNNLLAEKVKLGGFVEMANKICREYDEGSQQQCDKGLRELTLILNTAQVFNDTYDLKQLERLYKNVSRFVHNHFSDSPDEILRKLFEQIDKKVVEEIIPLEGCGQFKQEGSLLKHLQSCCYVKPLEDRSTMKTGHSITDNHYFRLKKPAPSPINGTTVTIEGNSATLKCQ